MFKKILSLVFLSLLFVNTNAFALNKFKVEMNSPFVLLVDRILVLDNSYIKTLKAPNTMINVLFDNSESTDDLLIQDLLLEITYEEDGILYQYMKTVDILDSIFSVRGVILYPFSLAELRVAAGEKKALGCDHCSLIIESIIGNQYIHSAFKDIKIKNISYTFNGFFEQNHVPVQNASQTVTPNISGN